MRGYMLGIITALGVLAGIAYFYLTLGYLGVRADVSPSSFESNYAMKFLDASVDRHAPPGDSPVQPTEANLRDGMHLYQDNCAMCHASPQHPEKKFGHPFHPPVPDFLKDAPDMEENANFYIIKHGVRWSGMPAWGNTLSDQQIWTLVTFLGHMGKLPAAVEQEWQRAEARSQEPEARSKK